MARIDNTDLKIINELTHDASISIPNMSKKININTSVIYARIKKLTDEKIIDHHTIIINDEKLGYKFKVIIGINIDKRIHDQIIKKLLKVNGVKKIIEVTGRFDMLIITYARSLEHVHLLVAEKIGGIEGIRSSESFIQTKTTINSAPYMSLTMGY